MSVVAFPARQHPTANQPKKDLYEIGEIPHGRLAFDPAEGGVVDAAEHPRAWRMRAEAMWRSVS